MEYLFPILLVAGIGLLDGIILAIASIVMAVPKDETAEAILEVLPGANCGACGYSGCSGYAAALTKGEAKVGLCSPGGPDCASAIAAILGTEAGEMERQAAVVACTGTLEVTKERMIYDGIASCAAAAATAGCCQMDSYILQNSSIAWQIPNTPAVTDVAFFTFSSIFSKAVIQSSNIMLASK